MKLSGDILELQHPDEAVQFGLRVAKAIGCRPYCRNKANSPILCPRCQIMEGLEDVLERLRERNVGEEDGQG